MSDRAHNGQVDIGTLHALFDDASMGVALIDADLRYVFVNAPLAARHQLTPEEHRGRLVAEVLPQHWDRLEPLLRRVLAGEASDSAYISEVTSPDTGTTQYWLSSYYPIYEGDRVSGIGLLIHDVTAVHAAEQALQLRTNMYSMLAATSRMVSICTSRDELFKRACEIAVSDGGFRLAWVGVPYLDTVRVAASAGAETGYLDALETADLMISLDPNDFRSRGPMGQAILRGVRAVVNNFSESKLTEPWRDTARQAGLHASAAFPMREGGRVAAVLSLYAGTTNFFTPELVDALGEITPALSTGLDRLALEDDRAAREAALQLRDRALNATTEGIVITDARAFDNPVVYVNNGFEELTGYSSDQIVGRNCRLLQGEGTDPAVRAQMRQHIEAGESCTVELVNYRRDGSPFRVRLSISPIFGSSGAISHFVGGLTNLSEASA